MRIAFVVDSFPPYISGVTTHYVTLAKHLIKAGHKVMIVAPKSKKAEIPSGLEKCKIVFVPSIPIGVAKNMRIGTPSTLKTILEYAKFKADIIELSGPSLIGIDALIASKILEIPTVSYFYTMITSPEYLQLIAVLGKTKALQKASWLYNRWFYNSSDTIFVPTRGVGKILSKNRFNKKTILAPVFTDIKESKNLSEKEKGVIKNRFRLKTHVALYLGRLSKEKNLDTLLYSWQKVVHRLPDSTLLIIGDGKYKNNLTKKVNELGLGQNVAFTGELGHKQIIESGIIKACDLYVSPSTSETFGISALEAMINGLPVVLVKSQGLCEVVDGAGIVCRQKNIEAVSKAILRIFNNANLRQKMSSKAKIIASKYDSNLGVNNILKIYTRIIEDYEANPNKKTPFKLF